MTYNILWIDDDADSLMTFAKKLKSASCTITKAFTHKQAIDEANSDKYDSVIMDWIVPLGSLTNDNICALKEWDPIRLIKELRKIQNCSAEELPIIILSSSASLVNKRIIGTKNVFVYSKLNLLDDIDNLLKIIRNCSLK